MEDKHLTKKLYIRIENSNDSDLLIAVKRILDQNPGQIEVILVLGPSQNKQPVRLPSRVDTAQDVLDSLETVVGADNVKFQ